MLSDVLAELIAGGVLLGVGWLFVRRFATRDEVRLQITAAVAKVHGELGEVRGELADVRGQLDDIASVGKELAAWREQVGQVQRAQGALEATARAAILELRAAARRASGVPEH